MRAPAETLYRLRKRFALAAGRAAALSGLTSQEAVRARDWRRLYSLAFEAARKAAIVEADAELRRHQAQRDIELASIAARNLNSLVGVA